MTDHAFQENTDSLEDEFPGREQYILRILSDWGPPANENPIPGGPDFRSSLCDAITVIAEIAKELRAALVEVESDAEMLDRLSVAYWASRQFADYPTYTAYLGSSHWKEVRTAAIERAGGLCMLCNDDEGGLHVHHRTYERLGEEDPMDVIVLCAKHHAQFHGKDGEA